MLVFFLIAQFALWIIYNNLRLPVDMAAIRKEMLNQFFQNGGLCIGLGCLCMEISTGETNLYLPAKLEEVLLVMVMRYDLWAINFYD